MHSRSHVCFYRHEQQQRTILRHHPIEQLPLLRLPYRERPRGESTHMEVALYQ